MNIRKISLISLLFLTVQTSFSFLDVVKPITEWLSDGSINYLQYGDGFTVVLPTNDNIFMHFKPDAKGNRPDSLFIPKMLAANLAYNQVLWQVTADLTGGPVVFEYQGRSYFFHNNCLWHLR